MMVNVPPGARNDLPWPFRLEDGGIQEPLPFFTHADRLALIGRWQNGRHKRSRPLNPHPETNADFE